MSKNSYKFHMYNQINNGRNFRIINKLYNRL